MRDVIYTKHTKTKIKTHKNKTTNKKDKELKAGSIQSANLLTFNCWMMCLQQQQQQQTKNKKQKTKTKQKNKTKQNKTNKQKKKTINIIVHKVE